jgi:hypothetical protein
VKNRVNSLLHKIQQNYPGNEDLNEKIRSVCVEMDRMDAKNTEFRVIMH